MLSTFNPANKWLMDHPKLEGISLMDHLFSRMNGTYPNKWRANFRDSQAIEDWKVSWAEAFDEDGITPNDIAVGIKNCRRLYDWPPSLPEFLRACRPMLDPETAFHEAVKGLVARRKGETGQWSHPAIYHAAVAAGQHDMLNSTYGAMKVRWGHALAEQLEKTDWAPIPEAHISLPEPKKTEMTDAEAAQAMKRIGADKVLERKGADMKAWARKIVESPQGRPLIAVTMAKRALELS